MKKEVFLSGYSLRLPGIDSLPDIEMMAEGQKNFLKKQVKLADPNRHAEFGELEFAHDIAHFPQRQDAKIMRQDVLAASICAGELMEKMGFPEDTVQDIPLYLSSGVFIENIFGQSDKTTEIFKKALTLTDRSKMREMLFKAVPPLLALNTLTNASSSYVAQYSNIAGRNTTLGNTSVSGAQSLALACSDITNGLSDVAVAGASSRGELFSFLTFSQFTDDQSSWRESAGACLLALSDKDFFEKQNSLPICRIESIDFSRNVPSLMAKTVIDDISFIHELKDFPFVVFSGAFTLDSFRQQETFFKSICSGKTFSWFPVLGNTGPVNSLLALLTCTVFMRKYKISSAVCVDIDPYNRQSLIKISLP